MSRFNGWIPWYEKDAPEPIPCTNNPHNERLCEDSFLRSIEIHLSNIATYAFQENKGPLLGHIEHLLETEHEYRLAQGWHKDAEIERIKEYLQSEYKRNGPPDVTTSIY